jgi:2,5-diketo-D-gluconate reductase A
VNALEAGYRSIDTAAAYQNGVGVGQALAASGIDRSDLFITTKLWNADQGYDSTLKAFDQSLSLLGLEYLDLYLIHWPTPARDLYVESWRALERLYADGRVRAIGVSNFQPEHLDRLAQSSRITPAGAAITAVIGPLLVSGEDPPTHNRWLHLRTHPAWGRGICR